MANTIDLKRELDNAYTKYVENVGEMRRRLEENGDFLSQEELLRIIGEETANCLLDYKTAILDAFSLI